MVLFSSIIKYIHAIRPRIRTKFLKEYLNVACDFFCCNKCTSSLLEGCQKLRWFMEMRLISSGYNK